MTAKVFKIPGQSNINQIGLKIGMQTNVNSMLSSFHDYLIDDDVKHFNR